MTGDDIRSAKFREKLRGYHPHDVDKALDRWADDLDHEVLVRSDVLNVHFRSKLRGYHTEDVDAFIERLLGQLP